MTYRAPVGLYSPIYIIFLLFRLAHNELYFKLPVYVCADRTCFLLNNNTSKNLNLCICTKIIMQYYTAPVTWSSYWKGKSSESTMAALHIVTGNWYATQPKNCIATALGCMECTGKRAACVNNRRMFDNYMSDRTYIDVVVYSLQRMSLTNTTEKLSFILVELRQIHWL